jgi:hypothetical protein
VVTEMMGIEREETGYETAGRRRFQYLARETTIVVGILTVAAVLSNPVAAFFEWLFSGSDDEDDDEPAPDYSRAERIPEEFR